MLYHPQYKMNIFEKSKILCHNCPIKSRRLSNHHKLPSTKKLKLLQKHSPVDGTCIDREGH